MVFQCVSPSRAVGGPSEAAVVGVDETSLKGKRIVPSARLLVERS
jgi:hypothetical protein